MSKTSRIMAPIEPLDQLDLCPMQLAYNAGIFDGEGCVHIARQTYPHRRRPCYRLRLDITQNNLAMLMDFQRELGVPGRIYEVARTMVQNRTCYSLKYDGRAAEEILRRLEPVLRRKRLEAEAALKFVTEGEIYRHFGPKGAPPHVWLLRARYYRKLRSLK